MWFFRVIGGTVTVIVGCAVVQCGVKMIFSA